MMKMSIDTKIEKIIGMSDGEKLSFYNSLSEQEKKNEKIVSIVAPLDHSIINNLDEPFKISMMMIRLRNGKFFYSLKDDFKKHKTIQEVALKYNIDVYDDLKSDNDGFSENLNFVKVNHLVLKKLPQFYQDDYEFIVEALRLNLNVWYILDDSIRKDLIKDEDFMKELVAFDGFFFLNIKDNYSENKEMIKECLNSLLMGSTNIFEHLSKDECKKIVNVDNIISDSLKQDKDFIYDLIDSMVLDSKYIADNFSYDIELLTHAIKKDSITYKYLNEELKLNDKLVEAYLAQKGAMLMFIPPGYLNTLEKVRNALEILEKNKNETITVADCKSISVLNENENFSKFLSSNVEVGQYGASYVNIENILSYVENFLMKKHIEPVSYKSKKRKF